MDVKFKEKIDSLIAEVSAITDLTTKVAVLNYIQQESGFLLWQLEDEQRIDEDSRDY
jgi:hypothetical protein